MNLYDEGTMLGLTLDSIPSLCGPDVKVYSRSL